MIKLYLIKILIFLKLKDFSKDILKLLRVFIKVILFIPNICLFFILRNNFQAERKKIFGLRLSRKYFGHLAIESAMASAYQEINKDSKIITSFKPGKGIDNKYLNSIHSLTFNLTNDFILILLNLFYYYSFSFIRRLLKKYYEPFIDKNNPAREVKYIDYLESSNDFPWRKVGRNLILHKKNNLRNIIIAMRTSYFHKKKIEVASQPWKDASVTDIYKIIRATNLLNNEEKVIFYTNKEIWRKIKNMEINIDKIRFVDQNKIDILDIINKDSLVINNGNGLGAGIYALGIKTLYLHHTAWHFWHTSHSNSLAYPCTFQNLNHNSKDLKRIIELAFISKSLPCNFQKNYYSKGVIHNKISDLDICSIKNSIIESFKIKSLEERSNSTCLGVDFYYSNMKEKYFWELFIKNQPNYLREFRKTITLNIASEFLNSYI